MTWRFERYGNFLMSFGGTWEFGNGEILSVSDVTITRDIEKANSTELKVPLTEDFEPGDLINIEKDAVVVFEGFVDTIKDTETHKVLNCVERAYELSNFRALHDGEPVATWDTELLSDITAELVAGTGWTIGATFIDHLVTGFEIDQETVLEAVTKLITKFGKKYVWFEGTTINCGLKRPEDFYTLIVWQTKELQEFVEQFDGVVVIGQPGIKGEFGNTAAGKKVKIARDDRLSSNYEAGVFAKKLFLSFGMKRRQGKITLPVDVPLLEGRLVKVPYNGGEIESIVVKSKISLASQSIEVTEYDFWKMFKEIYDVNDDGIADLAELTQDWYSGDVFPEGGVSGDVFVKGGVLYVFE